MSPGHPLISIALTLDRLTTKEVLGAVLHSVLFHRLLGTVKPGLVDVLDVTMPIVDDPETKTLVQEKVDAFWRGMEGGSNKKGQVIITFSEKRPKKSWFIMGEVGILNSLPHFFKYTE
ncbi:hypothetical protein NLI96_g4588 [Meripilus lineatus]|uniref:Autophagy-related protein 101 n=1 Tax=Meripilus lineatus TaxID=2056292 RepID=A0AAD5V4X9_9APHY|nr:hypothetical protein NLI96_g4588 [Physisporinus lineatus]